MNVKFALKFVALITAGLILLGKIIENPGVVSHMINHLISLL